MLALIGEEAPLQQLLEDGEAPAGVRRRAAESLGLLASRCRDGDKRQGIELELERQLRRPSHEVMVSQESDWERIDAVLPLLQGAARGLQLAAAVDLPLLGTGAGRVVPMLTLRALQEGGGMRVQTEVVEVPVWRLPLPGGEQMEMIVVPGGDYEIGSPREEDGRDFYTGIRKKCEGVEVEALRTVSLVSYGMARHPITQAQWRAVVDHTAEDDRGKVKVTPGTYRPEDLWERFGQPGGRPVDSVSWNDCQHWLALLNNWLREHWTELGGHGDAPQLALPSESQWEVACRAGSPKPFHFGDMLDPTWANYDDSYTFGHSRNMGLYRERPVSIGTFGLVNLWGLAEMHGQVAEWCGDLWHRDPRGSGWPSDGSPWEEPDQGLADFPLEQNERLFRGGSWFDATYRARAAYRDMTSSDNNSAFFGFRPCCLLPRGSLLGP